MLWQLFINSSTLSVLAHGTFPPPCWHKEVLSTTPATFTLQITGRSTVVSSKTREMMSESYGCCGGGVCNEVVCQCNCHPRLGAPLSSCNVKWLNLTLCSDVPGEQLSASLDTQGAQSSDNTVLHKMMINMGSNNGIPISADTIITTLTLVSSFHPVSSFWLEA